MRLPEAPVVVDFAFETVRRDVWGAGGAGREVVGVVGLGGECCDAGALGVRDGLGAALAEVKNLRRYLIG